MAAKLCSVCSKRRVGTGSKGTETAPHGSDMCNYCFEEAGWENTHSDYGHDAKSEEITSELGVAEAGKRVEGCWICFSELNLAQKPAKTGTGPKAQGARRPQLNHKSHSHPQTPAARRACKAAFWAYHRTPVNGTSEEISNAQVVWNYSCDGNGKPIAWHKEASPERKLAETAGLVKPATWTVAPRGPKGGVINQMKAAKPKAKFLTKAEGNKLYGK